MGYFCHAQRTPWLAVQLAGGRNHPPISVGFSCDLIIGLVQVHGDVSGLVVVEHAQSDASKLVFFAAIESSRRR